jgi:bifunctional DNA-binding transcriptional regulator/antitoxin component of YhaV-PrlF toxin-antitoxin module
MRTTAKVGKSGRAQIPIEIREKMGILDGDHLIIDIEQVIRNSSEMEDSLK